VTRSSTTTREVPLQPFLRIIELINEREFAKRMVKIHRALTQMEKTKYLEPYYSNTIEHLANYLRGQFVTLSIYP